MTHVMLFTIKLIAHTNGRRKKRREEGTTVEYLPAGKLHEEAHMRTHAKWQHPILRKAHYEKFQT